MASGEGESIDDVLDGGRGWVGDKNGGQKKANEVAADGEEID